MAGPTVPFCHTKSKHTIQGNPFFMWVQGHLNFDGLGWSQVLVVVCLLRWPWTRLKNGFFILLEQM